MKHKNLWSISRQKWRSIQWMLLALTFGGVFVVANTLKTHEKGYQIFEFLSIFTWSSQSFRQFQFLNFWGKPL
jgi:hypothetical protein